MTKADENLGRLIKKAREAKMLELFQQYLAGTSITVEMIDGFENGEKVSSKRLKEIIEVLGDKNQELENEWRKQNSDKYLSLDEYLEKAEPPTAEGFLDTAILLAGITNQALADKAGLGEKSIRIWRKDLSSISRDSILKLVNSLELEEKHEEQFWGLSNKIYLSLDEYMEKAEPPTAEGFLDTAILLAGITNQALADKADVAMKTIRNWKENLSSISKISILKLVKALELDERHEEQFLKLIEEKISILSEDKQLDSTSNKIYLSLDEYLEKAEPPTAEGFLDTAILLAGITNQALADKAGLGEKSIRIWRKDPSSISRKNIEKLVNSLELEEKHVKQFLGLLNKGISIEDISIEREKRRMAISKPETKLAKTASITGNPTIGDILNQFRSKQNNDRTR
ncbi:MAG: hypothetical protein WCJ33_08455 [Pseudomonadota bacterium]